MKTVELHQAFLWTCDECGRDNFARAVMVPPEAVPMDQLPDSVDKEAFQEWIDAGGSGDFSMMPAVVKCQWCGWSFETTQQGIEDEEPEREEDT